MILKTYNDQLDEVIRPDKELVKNHWTVKGAVKKLLTTHYKPCQIGLIHEVEFAIGLPQGKLPCHLCPNYDKYKCKGWG